MSITESYIGLLKLNNLAKEASQYPNWKPFVSHITSAFFECLGNLYESEQEQIILDFYEEIWDEFGEGNYNKVSKELEGIIKFLTSKN